MSSKQILICTRSPILPRRWRNLHRPNNRVHWKNIRPYLECHINKCPFSSKDICTNVCQSSTFFAKACLWLSLEFGYTVCSAVRESAVCLKLPKEQDFFLQIHASKQWRRFLLAVPKMKAKRNTATKPGSIIWVHQNGTVTDLNLKPNT